MKGFLIILLLAGAGYGVYRITSKPSPAYAAYLKWCETVRWGRCKTLSEMSEGQARAWVDQFCGGRFSAASVAGDMAGSPQSASRGFRYKRESESKAADGTVSLVVVERVVQRQSALSGPAPKPRRDTVKLKDFGGVWKLTEYATAEAAE